MRGREWVTVGAGFIALATAVFAIGGALRGVQLVVALLLAVAIVPLVLSRRTFKSISPLIALIAVAGGLTAIQLIPLPSSVLEALDGPSQVLRADGTELLATHPWQGISMDAPGSLRALAFFAILLGVATVSLRLSASEKGRYRIQAAVASVCGLAAVVSWLHELVGATELYGVYAPSHAHPALLGPLLNENHLGCLMAVGATLAIGLAMYRRQRNWKRIAWVVVVAVCGSATVATTSRGATLALAIGALTAVATAIAQRFVQTDSPRGRRGRFVVSSLPIGVVAGCVVVMVIYSSAGGVEDRFDRTTTEEIDRPKTKFAAWRSGIELVEEAPWVGVGRGAFEPVFTRVHPASGLATFAYLENEYEQALVDWGIPGALLLALAALWLAATALRRWREGALTAGALGALLVVAVQSNVDFGLEILGVALPITAIAATLGYVPVVETEPRIRGRARVALIALIVALVGAAALLFSDATTSLDEDHEALRGRSALSVDDLAAVAQRHPLDYVPYALAADRFAQRNDARAIPLLNHALLLHPSHEGLHRMAAHMLLASGHSDQAVTEYATAMRSAGDSDRVLAEILGAFDARMAAAAIPPELGQVDNIVQALDRLHHREVAPLWLERVLDAHPGDNHSCELLYQASIHQRDASAVAAARARCGEYEPSRQTRLELAVSMTADHHHAEVIEVLHDVERWDGLVETKFRAWLLRCNAMDALHHWDDARKCLHRLDASGNASSDAERAEIQSALDVNERNARPLIGTPPAPPGATSGSAPSRP